MTTGAGALCSGANLAALDGFGSAVTASSARQGEAVAVVDPASDSILVVARRDVTIILQVPIYQIAGPAAGVPTGEFDNLFEVSQPNRAAGSEVDMVRTVDGRRVLSSLLSEPFDEGSVLVIASEPDDVVLGADAPAIYVLLLAIGTTLLGLAAWTFLAERRQLERRATTDELTGLVNRREFERQSEEAIDMASRFGTGLCIMLIDLNGFKQVNDTHGHQFGDRVLKTCADRLQQAVRDTDVVGRWGGDEFVVLLPGLEEASAVRNSAERLGESLSATPVVDDVTMSGSVGAALYPRHGSGLDELMQAADVAMYEAKTTGVVHRLADWSATGDDAATGYGGPERRRSDAAAHVSEHGA